jgi:hypothetical protein
MAVAMTSPAPPITVRFMKLRREISSDFLFSAISGPPEITIRGQTSFITERRDLGGEPIFRELMGKVQAYVFY